MSDSDSDSEQSRNSETQTPSISRISSIPQTPPMTPSNSKHSIGEPWPCNQCTFENKQSSTKCEMCDQARSSEKISMSSDSDSDLDSEQSRNSETPTPPMTPSNSKHSIGEPWPCSQCTFENKQSATKCEMCDQARSSEQQSESDSDTRSDDEDSYSSTESCTSRDASDDSCGVAAPLHDACSRQDIGVVQATCQNGNIDVNSLDKGGSTCLYIACKRGYSDIVTALCQVDDIDINLGLHNETPLMVACKGNHTNVVAALCENEHVDVTATATFNKHSPLYIACTNGNFEIVKKLCEVDNIDINCRTATHRTPLHGACGRAHSDIVKLLCTLKRIEINSQTKGGRTALFQACENDHLEIVSILCENQWIDANLQTQNGDTALHAACFKNNFYIIKLLCELKDIDVNVQNKNDDIALELLMGTQKVSSFYGNSLSLQKRQFAIDLVQILVEKNAKLIIKKKAATRTLYDVFMDYYGYESGELIALLGVENFTFGQSAFLPFDMLLNLKLFNGGVYGDLYKADIDIARGSILSKNTDPVIAPTAKVVNFEQEEVSRSRLSDPTPTIMFHKFEQRHREEEEKQRDTKILIPVVCKVSKAKSGANEWYELQVLQNLPNHENVTGLVAVCTGFKPQDGSGMLYTALIMNYKSGGSLLQLLRKNKEKVLPLRDLCAMGLDFVDGILHMHQGLYKHCDIAARNILVSNHSTRAVLSITDFGMSRPHLENHGKDTKFPIKWCAPETLEHTTTSFRSDTWMVGIVFYELAAFVYREPYYPLLPAPKELLEMLKRGTDCYSSRYSKKMVPPEWIELQKFCCQISEDERPTLEDLKDRLKILAGNAEHCGLDVIGTGVTDEHKGCSAPQVQSEQLVSEDSQHEYHKIPNTGHVDSLGIDSQLNTSNLADTDEYQELPSQSTEDEDPVLLVSDSEKESKEGGQSVVYMSLRNSNTDDKSEELKIAMQELDFLKLKVIQLKNALATKDEQATVQAEKKFSAQKNKVDTIAENISMSDSDSGSEQSRNSETHTPSISRTPSISQTPPMTPSNSEHSAEGCT